jgi:hypothetical protein
MPSRLPSLQRLFVDWTRSEVDDVTYAFPRGFEPCILNATASALS